MGNAIVSCGGGAAKALAVFEALSSQVGTDVVVPAGSWLVLATDLEIAADHARFAGQTSQVAKLRDRADECRRNALSASRQAVR